MQLISKFYAKLFIFSWLVCVSSLTSCTQYQEPPQKPIQYSYWKIEKAEQPTSYLIGTIHVNTINQPIPNLVEQALNKSTRLMTEVIMPISKEAIERSGYFVLMYSMYNFSDSNNLKKGISNKAYTLVKQYIANNPSFNIEKEKLEYINPWALELLLSNINVAGYSFVYGLDMQLAKLAYDKKIAQSELETVFDMAKVFQGMPKDRLSYSIEVSLENYKQGEQDLKQLVDLYNDQQIEQIFTQFFNADSLLKNYDKNNRDYFYDIFYNQLLAKRNNAWMTKILPQLAKEPTMIAVGLAHLNGKTGLVEQLRQNGYTVTPLVAK